MHGRRVVVAPSNSSALNKLEERVNIPILQSVGHRAPRPCRILSWAPFLHPIRRVNACYGLIPLNRSRPLEARRSHCCQTCSGRRRHLTLQYLGLRSRSFFLFCAGTWSMLPDMRPRGLRRRAVCRTRRLTKLNSRVGGQQRPSRQALVMFLCASV